MTVDVLTTTTIRAERRSLIAAPLISAVSVDVNDDQFVAEFAGKRGSSDLFRAACSGWDKRLTLQVEVDGIALADGIVGGTFVDERTAANDVACLAFGEVVFDDAEA